MYRQFNVMPRTNKIAAAVFAIVCKSDRVVHYLLQYYYIPGKDNAEDFDTSAAIEG